MSYFQRNVAGWVPLGSRAVPDEIKNQFRTIGDRSPIPYNPSVYHLVDPKKPLAKIDGSFMGVCAVCNVPYPMWTQHCPGIRIVWDSFHAQNIRTWLKDGRIDFIGHSWVLEPSWIKQVNVLQDTVNHPPKDSGTIRAMEQMKAAGIITPEQAQETVNQIMKHNVQFVSRYLPSPLRMPHG